MISVGDRLALKTSLAVIFSLVFSSALAETYRYKDENDKWAFGPAVPPEFVHKGYDVYDDKMMLIKRVPRSLTQEEIAQKKLKASKELSAEQQRKEDDKLLKRFTSLDEIDLVKSRKINELEGKVSILQGNINGIRQEIENLQSRAAMIERRGGEVPAAILDKISVLRKTDEDTQLIVEQRRLEIDAVAQKYDVYKARFTQIKTGRNQ